MAASCNYVVNFGYKKKLKLGHACMKECMEKI